MTGFLAEFKFKAEMAYMVNKIAEDGLPKSPWLVILLALMLVSHVQPRISTLLTGSDLVEYMRGTTGISYW